MGWTGWCFMIIDAQHSSIFVHGESLLIILRISNCLVPDFSQTLYNSLS